MEKYTEQTEIAKQLGISNKKFRQMVETRAGFKLIDNKRHYLNSDVYKVIQQARDVL